MDIKVTFNIKKATKEQKAAIQLLRDADNVKTEYIHFNVEDELREAEKQKVLFINEAEFFFPYTDKPSLRGRIFKIDG